MARRPTTRSTRTQPEAEAAEPATRKPAPEPTVEATPAPVAEAAAEVSAGREADSTTADARAEADVGAGDTAASGDASARVDDSEASISVESSTTTEANPLDITPRGKGLSVDVGPDGVEVSGEVGVGSQTYSGGGNQRLPGGSDPVEAAEEGAGTVRETVEATREAVVGGAEAFVEGAEVGGTGDDSLDITPRGKGLSVDVGPDGVEVSGEVEVGSQTYSGGGNQGVPGVPDPVEAAEEGAEVVGTGVASVVEGTRRAADAGADLAERGQDFLDDAADSSGGVEVEDGPIDVARVPAGPGPDAPVPVPAISDESAEAFEDAQEAASDAGGTAADNLLDASEIAKGDFGSVGADGGWTEADAMLNFGEGQTVPGGPGSSGQSGPGDGVDFGDDANVDGFVEEVEDGLGDLAEGATEAGGSIVDEVGDAVDEFADDAEDTKDDVEDAVEDATGLDLPW